MHIMKRGRERGEETMPDLKRFLELHKHELLGLPRVVGVGLGYKEVRGKPTSTPAIIVCVSKKIPPQALGAGEGVPRIWRGAITDVLEIGEVKTLSFAAGRAPAINERTARLRPAPPGVSLAHYLVPFGTFGAVVRRQRTGEAMILSNNHVLANSTDGMDGRSKPGDPILQPSPGDGGTLEDAIATLDDFVPLSFGGEANLVDAALAAPIRRELITERPLGLGKPGGTAEPRLGLTVFKSGRTSGVSRGRIRLVDLRIRIFYGESRWALLEDQFLTNKMGGPGDSGSLLVDQNMRAVGLLVGGTETATIYSCISNVLRLLEVTI
ncbi:MAG: hypothetical protein PWP65_70 [Clostridia bacterium]|nr:hypothetical protein [Clostridia bacterium]